MSAVMPPPQGAFSFPGPVRGRPATGGPRRGVGLLVVVSVHGAAAWLLTSGLAHKAVEFVKKPLEMAIITEAPPPPPPPPPKIEKFRELPKVQAPPPPAYVPPPDITPVVPPPAPVIQAVQPEPQPVVIEPPAPPPPVPEPVRPAVVKQEISLACPGYKTVVAQAMEEAMDRVGIAGTVRTLIKVKGDQVVDVVPQSGPKEYYRYLQAAIKRMKCSAGGDSEVQVTLDVSFRR